MRAATPARRIPMTKPDRAARIAADDIARLRAAAENPLVRPSVRVEARLALKTIAPAARRSTAATTRAAHDWPEDE